MPEEITKKDIEEFLENKSSYSDAENIASFLKENEALQEVYIPFDSDGTSRLSLKEKRIILKRITGRQDAGILRSMKRGLVAASVLVAVSISGFWLFNHDRHTTSEETVAVATPDATVVIRNNAQELLAVYLPDSSLVHLATLSEITYDSISFNHLRDIQLTAGAAHFDVKKDASRPFRVIASGVQTTAVGTDFWVEQSVDSSKVTVRLLSGKVRVNSVDENFKMEEVELAPGQVCSVNKTTGSVDIYTKSTNHPKKPSATMRVTKGDNEEKSIVWTNNEMQFSKTRLRSVFDKLEARYDVKVIVDEDIIKNSVFTGKILNTDSLEQIIKSICEINKLSYEMRGDTVLIKK